MERWAVWVGGAATAVFVASSMAMNGIYLMGQGKTALEAWVFLALSVAGDAWKAVLPLTIAAAWQRRAFGKASIASVFLMLALVFSFGSALGYAAQNRGFLSGTRAFASARLKGLEEEARRIARQLGTLGDGRAVAVIEADLESLRGQPEFERSGACQSPAGRAGREVCARYHALRTELAEAAERTRLIDARRANEAETGRLVAAGAGQDSDGQAGFLARMTGYAAASVRDVLVVGVALLVEAGSAFGLLLCASGRGGSTDAPRRPERLRSPGRREISRRIGGAQDSSGTHLH